MALENGPYVQAACFCEAVIEDKTNVLSLIRVIDTITHIFAGPLPPEQMPPMTHMMRLVLMLKPGQARGQRNLKILPVTPLGETLEPVVVTANFEEEEKGLNYVFQVNITFSQEGLYWFNVYLEEDKLTAIPFRVIYSPRATSSITT